MSFADILAAIVIGAAIALAAGGLFTLLVIAPMSMAGRLSDQERKHWIERGE